MSINSFAFPVAQSYMLTSLGNPASNWCNEHELLALALVDQTIILFHEGKETTLHREPYSLLDALCS